MSEEKKAQAPDAAPLKDRLKAALGGPTLTTEQVVLFDAMCAFLVEFQEKEIAENISLKMHGGQLPQSAVAPLRHAVVTGLHTGFSNFRGVLFNMISLHKAAAEEAQAAESGQPQAGEDTMDAVEVAPGVIHGQLNGLDSDPAKK